MKVQLTSYLASDLGLTIYLLPETDIELELLKGFGRHGAKPYCQDGQLRIEWKFEGKQNGES